MITESKSIGIFIDGGYFSKINEALANQLSLNIKIKSLFEFIRAEIARRQRGWSGLIAILPKVTISEAVIG